jgi:hypothetical protein
MNIDTRDFSELRRKASEMMSETADLPTVLRSRLGEEHRLTRSATEMTASIETLVRELRAFDSSDEALSSETFPDTY